MLHLPWVSAVLGTEPRSYPASLLLAGFTLSPVWGARRLGCWWGPAPGIRTEAACPGTAAWATSAVRQTNELLLLISSPLISWQLPIPGAGKHALNTVPNTHLEMPLLCRCQLPIWWEPALITTKDKQREQVPSFFSDENYGLSHRACHGGCRLSSLSYAELWSCCHSWECSD